MDNVNHELAISEPYINAVLKERFEDTPSEGNLSANELVDSLMQRIKDVQKGETLIVSLVGGAASGKTTLSESLSSALEKHGVSMARISTDDYSRGTREWRHKEFGSTGRHQLEKYDFPHLNTLIEKIKAIDDDYTTVAVPEYDDKTGMAVAVGEENYTRRIGKVDVLLVEGDFDEAQGIDLRIYLHIPDEQRLETRIARDLAKRGESKPEVVKANFFGRQRAQHEPHTLPASDHADLLIIGDATAANWKYQLYERV